MLKFWRIAAYTFLALSGMYAWLSIQSGWRHYLGLVIFFFASVRIMVLIFPRRPGRDNTQKADRLEPSCAPDNTKPD